MRILLGLMGFDADADADDGKIYLVGKNRSRNCLILVVSFPTPLMFLVFILEAKELGKLRLV